MHLFLVTKGGDAETTMRALKLEKVTDAGAVEGAVARVLAAQAAADSERYLRLSGAWASCQQLA